MEKEGEGEMKKEPKPSFNWLLMQQNVSNLLDKANDTFTKVPIKNYKTTKVSVSH